MPRAIVSQQQKMRKVDKLLQTGTECENHAALSVSQLGEMSTKPIIMVKKNYHVTLVIIFNLAEIQIS